MGASAEIMNLDGGFESSGEGVRPASIAASAALDRRSFSSSCKMNSSLFMIFLTLANGSVWIFQFSEAAQTTQDISKNKAKQDIENTNGTR
jgi:hypothetical protein